MADWLKKANEVLGNLAGEAGRQAQIVKLQAKLGSLEDDLDRAYVEAGKRAEELLQARQIHDDQLRVILERARKIKEEMTQVREAVQQARQKPESEEEPAAEPEPQSEPEPAAEAPPQPTSNSEVTAEMACPSCGGAITRHMAFCPHCGETLAEPDDR